MKIFIGIFFLLVSLTIGAQTATVSGKVTDNSTKQPAVGAKIIFSEDFKAITDFDGNYTIKNVPFGEYNVTITMISVETTNAVVVVDKENFQNNVIIGVDKVLDEVNVIASLAKDRKTPVAVSTLSKKEIVEELGSQDLPMILNSKPGVHATQQGGGDGDSRISIRGFDQRNIGVMIDGVPVNDMENGAVYWSNWFGLDAITEQIQIQRGLGATKLAMPSVGGTMNIITDNTGGKREIQVKQEYGSGDFIRTSMSYKSGTLKNGWGVLFSGSYKQGNGWVDGLNTQGGFYYLKVQKKVNNHVVSFSGFGAPQQHGQRSFSQKTEFWSADYATRLGVTNQDTINVDYGTRFNQHWGYITDEKGNKVQKNERINYYHKPQLTLKDFWKINDKLSWTNLAYMSIGRGGGVRYFGSSSTIIRDNEGLIDWDQIEYNNQYKTLFGTVYSTADAAYDPLLLQSSQILSASVNNHFWVGGLSQFDYKMNDKINLSGGLDYRFYKGEHYTEIKDLLGGDYFVSAADKNSATSMKVVGDKFADAAKPYQNYRDGLVQWIGSFFQAEYSTSKISAFINISGVENGYKGIDYFNKKNLQVGDTTLQIGYKDTINYNGTQYTRDSEGLEYDNTGWKWLAGGTIKTGMNFNVTEKSNVFVNLGYLSRTPQYSNVVDNNTNQFFVEIENEKISAIEVGYGYRAKKFKANVNAYYTYWQNKPFPFGVKVPDPTDPGEFLQANVNGMDALHYGIEFDGIYYLSEKITLDFMASIGNWTWNSSETIDVLGTLYQFDAKGVHIGNSAQSTYGSGIRWQFVKNGYVKLKYNYFDRYYSDFDPFSLTGASGGSESWQIPSYGMMSLSAGYNFKFDKSKLFIRGNVFNLLNSLYISDAGPIQSGTDFTVNTAAVFVGQGTTFNISLGFQF